VVSQARTYEERVERAATTRTLLEGSPIQLVDGLDMDGLINPVWCTYGPAPNATYLIGQDGIIRLAERWTDGAHVEAAIRELLQAGEQTGGREQSAGTAATAFRFPDPVHRKRPPWQLWQVPGSGR
jgi:hypothetical protein